MRRRPTPVPDERVSETDSDDVQSVENDENTPIHDENALSQPTYAPVHRSSSVFAFRTPISHSRTDQDTALRDITDQFFHPPSPSPVRVAKPKRSAEPPRRPKKPKSLAYPADPPNWLHSHSSSSLPPSSPFPPSTTNFDHARLTDPVGIPNTAQYEYCIDTPSKASDSDPFGFVAVERAVKAKRVPHKSTKLISVVKSPPRSTVLASAPSHAPSFASLSQLDAPIPTNLEDIEGLYTDEPIAGPSHTHVPVAPLLMMNSDQPLVEKDATCSQPTFPDPLRTPRKRKRHASPTFDGDPELDGDGASPPSSPSPVKISTDVGSHRQPGTVQSSNASALKITRAQLRAVDTKPPATQVSRAKRVKRSYQDIPTPSSTPVFVRRSSRQSSGPPTPVPPRRSTRKAVVGARVEAKHTTSNEEDDGHDRMKLRSRTTKAPVAREAKTTKSASVKPPPVKPKTRTRSQKATTTRPAQPARGRPKGKQSAKDTKGKGKAGPLENVLELSDDTREVRLIGNERD